MNDDFYNLDTSVDQSEKFLKMDMKSQSLYFTLSNSADSIGYISDIKSILEDYPSYCLQDLIINKFVAKYGTGFLVIRDLCQLD